MPTNRPTAVASPQIRVLDCHTLLQGPRQVPMKILILEDNEDTASTLKALLCLVGHEARVAHDGETALDVLRDFDAEIVLCDVGLPGGMSGWDFARLVRGDAELSHVILIAVTAYSDPTDIEHSRAAGFDDHWSKPMDPRKLLSRLDKLALTKEEVLRPQERICSVH